MTETTIEAVIFDLGRVLVAIDNRVMVEKLFAHIGTEDPQLVAKTMKSVHMVDLCSGRIDLRQFHRRMSETYHSDLGYEEFKELWCSIFFTMDGAEGLVNQLGGTIKLGLLSDTDPVHWQFICSQWPWVATIPNPTLSFEAGLMKPDPAIYRKAAENVGVPPEKCLFIDDLAANIDGARAIGMTAVQFKNIEQIRDVLETYHLL